MKEKLVLAFDCGTQSTRAMLFNERGDLVAKAKECFEPYFSRGAGLCEQEPELYWEKLCAASKKLKAENPALWDSIIGISVTSIRDTGICVDKSVKPLRPCIMWLDQRVAKCPKKLPFITQLLFGVSGMSDATRKIRKEAKCNWIAENEPEIWAKTDKYIQYSTYLNYKLTGEIKDSIASTIGHIPFDYKNKHWMPEKHFQRPIFNIEQKMLYPLVEPGSELGRISAEAAQQTGIPEGLPVIAAGSDKGCETLGAGAVYPDAASISFGTTATIQITTGKYVEPELFCPAYPAVYPGKFNPEIMVYRGYWMMKWFMKEFARGKDGAPCYTEKELDKMLPTVPPGCGGLIVEPYWSPTLKKTEARGAMLGFDSRHTLFHVYRAIIEGLNFFLMKGLYGMEKKAGTQIKYLMVSGGGSSSDEICKITADMFGLPVRRVQTYETSGLGAAICGFVGLGVFADYDSALKNMVRVTDEFLPDPARRAEYARIYKEVYTKIYKRIKPLNATISKINKGE